LRSSAISIPASNVAAHDATPLIRMIVTGTIVLDGGLDAQLTGPGARFVH
jgi:hypothetical protein